MSNLLTLRPAPRRTGRLPGGNNATDVALAIHKAR